MTQYPFSPHTNHDGTAKLETDAEFQKRVIDCLERLDALDRRGRAERHIWLGKHQVSVNGLYWERSETIAVMQEARSSYLHGAFIATLVLALAYIEHVINDALPPPKKRSPTMSDAIKKAQEASLFTDDLLNRTARLNTLRNPFIHRRAPDDPDTIGQRVLELKEHPSSILETEAREALVVMYGFFRYSFTPHLPP